MIDGILKFLLNALKAILLSPFYLVIFAFYLIINIFVFVIGIFKSIFSGFLYGTKKGNKYERELREAVAHLQEQGGAN